MNIRIIFLGLCFIFCHYKMIAQEVKLSLEFKSGHLFSEWLLNDTIPTRVMLETGFPKVVINEKFVNKYLKGKVKMEKAPENTQIALWGRKGSNKVSYFIKDTLVINGKEIMIDALVSDFSSNKSWKNRDIVFPLRDLPGITEVNIKDQYMIIDRSLKYSSDYLEFNVEYDEGTKGLYLETSLNIFDSLQTKEILKGRFLLDLGAPNAIFLNRTNSKVENFVNQSDRMILKDTTRFKPNPRMNLSIIMPNKINIDKISLKGEYIVALNLFGKQSEKYIGIIGNHFFKNFTIIFDYERNKICLKPTTDNVFFLNKIENPNR